MSDRQFRRKYIDYDEKYYVNAKEAAQKMIFDFVRDYFGKEKLNEVKKVIDNFPVHYFDRTSFRKKQLDNKDIITDEFITEAYVDASQLNLPKNYTRVYSASLIEYETAIITTIHEYGHILRRINSKYGSLFEEGFVTIFAEACYTYSKLKSGINYDPNEINVSSDGNYFKAESQVRAILYFLNQKKLDISLIGEYIFGDENKFANKCAEIFGKEFIDYFKLANSNKDQYYNDYSDEKNNSEILLINLLSKFINNNSYLRNNNKFLYRKDSLTLSKSISKSNIKPTTEEGKLKYQEHRKVAEYALNEENEEKREKARRIREYVLKKCSLEGKNKSEIYDVIVDICMEYIKRYSSDIIENKIFIQELKSYIPKLEEIIDIFRVLRSNGVMNLDFNNLDNNIITYDNIYNSLKDTYSEFKINKEREVSHIFDKCISKADLLKTIGDLKSYSGIIDVDTIFYNYSNFVKYVEIMEKDIPETFNSNSNGYNFIYEAILRMYLLHQEKALSDLKKLENDYKEETLKLDKQFRVIENSADFKISIQMDVELHDKLNSLNTKLDSEEKNNKDNDEQRNNLYKVHSKLKNKNFIIRLFQRKKIKNIEMQIKEFESKIDDCNSHIKGIENDISNVKQKIKDNEKALLDKYGISISEYKSLLDEIKNEDLTEEEITKKILEIQRQIQALNIQNLEKEIQDIYINNSSILNSAEIIQNRDNLTK